MIKQFGKMLLSGKSGVSSAAASSFVKGQKGTARLVKANLKAAGESNRIVSSVAGSKAAANGSRIRKYAPRAGVSTAALTVGVGVPSFFSGINKDNQVSDSMYNLAFGDPNFDEYVTGRKMGLRSLAMPLPGERTMQGLTPQGMMGKAVGGTAVGAGVGLGAGALFSTGFGLKGIRGMAVKGLGMAAGAAVGAGAGGHAAFNNQPYRDAWRANRKDKMQVDGSAVLGMYNARLG